MTMDFDRFRRVGKRLHDKLRKGRRSRKEARKPTATNPAPEPRPVSVWERKPDWNERSPILVRRDLVQQTQQCLRTRRDAVAAMREETLEKLRNQYLLDKLEPAELHREKKRLAEFRPEGSVGLALSGGGIRSATISLGVVQGLASKSRLLDFDYCSTVSGGGYCGSFLGALFMPDYARGDVPQDDPREGRRNDQAQDKARFALAALRHDPRQTECRFPVNDAQDCDCDERRVLNPIWWLREHSRYLAPSGMTDYLLALATVIRNWLSMLYVLILPMALLALTLIVSTWLASFPPATPEQKVANHNAVSQARETAPRNDANAVAKVVAEKIGCLVFPDAQGSVRPDCRDDKVRTECAPCPDIRCAPCTAKQCTQEKCEPAANPVPFSLIFFLGAVPMTFWVVALGMAFWLTAYMSLDDSPVWRERLGRLWSSWWAFKLTGIIVACALAGLSWLFSAYVRERQEVTASTSWFAVSVGLFFATWLLAVAPWAAAHRVCRKVWRESRSTDAYTAAVRLRLTRWLSMSMRILLWTLAIGVLDSFSRWSYVSYTSHKGEFAIGALAPAGAFLLSKVWQGVSQPSSGMLRLLNRYFGIVMMIASIICYGALAVAVHVGVQHLIFEGHPWAGIDLGACVQRLIVDSQWLKVIVEFVVAPSQWEPFPVVEIRFAVLAILLLVVGFIAGNSSAFINLSSLHSFYASRLTRAYLGAANIERLQDWVDPLRSSRITEAHPGDQIEISSYQRSFAEGRNLAPMHLINVTLNETRSEDRSQVLERDRKGVPLVFAPEGMLINAGKQLNDHTYHEWDKMSVVEMLSVGQLCAVSGAAASTGMGSRTTLGTALAMTFANVRLGYWWSLNGLLTRRPDRAPDSGPLGWLRPFETYAYLLREMTARYDRGTRRVNISDGGHFENSGVYELLRRRVKTILVADNGADREFHFGDLEQLMRKARLDLGVEVSVPDAARTRKLLADLGVSAFKSRTAPDLEALFLNCAAKDWRRAAAEREADGDASAEAAKNLQTAVPHGSAFCLVLEAQVIDVMHNGVKEDPYYGLIVWMKPRLFEGLTHDVAGYATGHPAFPHETTSDQFFDEAQWESYRKLGETMIDRLLGAEDERRNDLFRVIAKGLDGHHSPP